MAKENQASNNLNSPRREYRKPSERAARFILGIFNWLRDIFHSTTTTLPPGQVLDHSGQDPAVGKKIRFPHILLVEDNPITAQEFIEAVKDYYLFGSIRIFVAYTYAAAITYFDNEDINLVIMDADLDDEDGDGVDLTRKFIGERPEMIILANSSRKISNLKLTGCGASETLGKNTARLKSWFLLNDPVGKRGY